MLVESNSSLGFCLSILTGKAAVSRFAEDGSDHCNSDFEI